MRTSVSRISGNALAVRDRLKSAKIPTPTPTTKQGGAFLCCCCCYAFTTFALNKGVGFSSNSSMTTPTRSGEKQLKALWAGAYEAWIDCPESREKVLYMKPTLNTNTSTMSSSNSDDDAFQFPSWLRRKQVFALTAHNPQGMEVSRARNERANVEHDREDLRSQKFPNQPASTQKGIEAHNQRSQEG